MSLSRPTRRAFLLTLPAFAAACGPAEPVWAPDALVESVRYRHPGPPRLTLFTMRSRSSGRGFHTGLMVSASERVIFDPAGAWGANTLPERNDVIFGVTPGVEQYYITVHARETFFVSRVDLDVPAPVAELALARVKSYGAVPKARCTIATARVLSGLPGFGHIRSTWWPGELEQQVKAMPGAAHRTYVENDSDDKSIARAAYDAQQAAAGQIAPVAASPE